MKMLLLLALIAIPFFCNAQDLKNKHLDELFDRLETKNQAMGSFSIAEKGKVVYQRAFGYASLNPEIKADSTTRYQVGSISKTFTAVIILQMVHEGKLSLQEPLFRFFPKWPQAEQITIEQLLRHRSGIHNFGEDRSEKYSLVNPQTREEILEIFEQAPIDFKPGSRAEYNNANYVVLSLIAEEIDGTSFTETFQARIVKPLQLRYTYVGRNAGQPSHEAQSYYWRRGWQKHPEGDLSTLMGAGAIVSTPAEVNVFFAAIFNEEFFPQEMISKMISLEDGFGMGIFRYPFNHRSCYGHAGSIGAFESMAAHFPDEEISFALCLNATRRPLNDVLVEALKVWFGEFD
ncbi:MAG: serine hydrolase domain-containing protein [Bacteroidia bacterium]